MPGMLGEAPDTRGCGCAIFTIIILAGFGLYNLVVYLVIPFLSRIHITVA